MNSSNLQLKDLYFKTKKLINIVKLFYKLLMVRLYQNGFNLIKIIELFTVMQLIMEYLKLI